MSAAVLSRADAARYLGVSTDTLDRLRASGRIHASQVSARLVKYRTRDLDAYLEQCLTTPSSASERRPTGTSNGPRVDAAAAVRRARQIVSKQRQSLRRRA